MDSEPASVISEDLFHIALLIDQLRHDDTNVRNTAAKSLTRIAKALGPERTRDELIPFIYESTDDEDAVIATIAEQLGDMVEYVGGSAYAYTILEPLSVLATAEESCVRDQAVRAADRVVGSLPETHLYTYLVPLITKLAGKESFTSRISAVSFIPIALSRLTQFTPSTSNPNTTHQDDLAEMFLKLCVDETPIVRKVAAQHLGQVTKDLMNLIANTSAGANVAQGTIPSNVLKAFAALANDDQDSVRIQAIQNCVFLAEISSADMRLNQILPVVVSLSCDRSWRVRWSFSNGLHEICRGVGEEITNSSLVNVFQTLLEDMEPEVRAAAVSHIHEIIVLMRVENIVSLVLPPLYRLAMDNSEFVRTSFAASLNHMAAIVGKDATVEHLLPVMLTLLRDSASSVRLNVISNLDAINKVIGVELLSQSLLPAIIELAEDNKWRVRLAIISHIPVLAGHLGPIFFSESLVTLTLSWLTDHVYSIRRAAAENLNQLSKSFGEAWTIQHFIPRVVEMSTNSNHLQRMTCLYAIQMLFPNLSKTYVLESLYPIVLSLAKDPVANTRFTSAKTIAMMVPYFHGNSTGGSEASSPSPKGSPAKAHVACSTHQVQYIEQQATQVLTLLSSADEDDVDVRFFAVKAIKSLQKNAN